MSPRFKSVLAATDFSETANRALPYAWALVEPGGEVHLVHILEHTEVPNPLYAHYTRAALHDPERRARIVAEVEARLRALIPAEDPERPVSCQVGVGLSETVPAGLVDEAQKRHVDAIVIASHGRTGLGHLLMGSVAERVLRSSPVPVLVVPGSGTNTSS